MRQALLCPGDFMSMLGMSGFDELTNARWVLQKQFIERMFDINEQPKAWYNPNVFVQIYTSVYEFCTSKRQDSAAANSNYQQFNYGEELYVLLKNQLVCSMDSWVLLIDKGGHGKEFVDKYLYLWERFKEFLPIFENAYSYLERFWIERKFEEKDRAGVYYIRQLLYHLWLDKIINCSEGALKIFIAGLRGMERPEIAKVKKIVESYKYLSVPFSPAHKPASRIQTEVVTFENSLLPWYCEDLSKYYDQKTSSITSAYEGGSISLNEVRAIYDFWKVETDLATEIFGSETLPFIKDVLKKHLLEPVCEKVYGLFEGYLLDAANPIENLKNIYDLLVVRKSLLKPLAERFERSLVRRLYIISPRIPTRNDSELTFFEYFEILKNLYYQTEEILRIALRRNDDLVKARDGAFRKIVSGNDAAVVAEYLARWSNYLLLSPGTLCDDLDFITCILNYSNEKELFHSFYAKFLATRLLSSSINKQFEDQLLANLKNISGGGFCQNLERMLNDMDQSRELTDSFQGREKRARMDYNCKYQILTQGSWPNEFNDGSNVQFPREFSDIVRSFEAFYKKKFSGRVLQWLSTLSTVEIAGCFSGQTYIFHVNVLQYSILEPLVNSDIPISLDELMGRIPDRNKLVEVLDQLLIAGLVLKSDDKFTINSGFQHASHDVILCHYLAKASGRPTEQADQTIERSTDRGPLIQATIMRYMKVAKESAIGTLIDNVADLLAKRLVPDRAEIEKALELLVVREFLRKDPKKRSIVHFVP